MPTIYKFDSQQIATGETREIPATGGAPLGWTRTAPPATTPPEVAYFSGVGGWSILPERPPAPPVPVKPPTETEQLAVLTRIAATGAIVNETASMEDAKILAGLFPLWEPDVAVTLNTLLQFDGELYKVVQAHTTQADWTPPQVPALFTPVSAPGVVPEWVQPTGAQDAYAIDAEVKHDNPNDGGNVWLYKSKIAANTTEPGRDGTFDRYWLPVEAV